jgi:hypothetical protein
MELVSGPTDSNKEIKGLTTIMAMQGFGHDLTSSHGKIHVNTLSHAKCNVQEFQHVGSIFDPLQLMRCLPARLVTYPWEEFIRATC